MLALGISCSVIAGALALFFSIISGSRHRVYKIILLAGTICCAVASCVGYCLSSVDGNIAGGGVFCAFAIVLLLTVGFNLYDDDFETLIYALVITAAFFAVSVACFLNINYFLGFGIACTFLTVAFAIAVGRIFYTGTDNSAAEIFAKVLSAVLAVASAGGLVAGYTIYDMNKDPVTADIECTVYEYDTVTQNTVKAVEDGKLCVGEYYAVQFNFGLKNLSGLGGSTQTMQASVDFSTSVANYVSDGCVFTKSTSSSIWLYKFTVDSKSPENFSSGLFILRYDLESLSNPIKKLKTKLYAYGEESGSTLTLMKSRSFEYKLVKPAYDFSEKDIIKDLGAGEDYCYRITVPENCTEFSITVYDDKKTGMYCSTVEIVNGKYYYVKLLDYLSANMKTAGYTEMMKQTRTVIFTIVAVESDYYIDTAVDYNITLVKK